MHTDRLHVDLGNRGYDIVIGAGLLEKAGELITPSLRRGRVAIISDHTVAKLHLKTLTAGLDRAGISSTEILVPPGEASKSFESYTQVSRKLLEAKIERGDAILAFGGGVVGDLAGFCAATLRRGVDLIQIPTTLLAQVDSSVGGKTGINAPEGKNLIGAFHQPVLVLADQLVLNTLSMRELCAGYAEVVKYGLLGDSDFFSWLEKHGKALLQGDMETRIKAVRHSCQAKAAIVARDEFEVGERALLNLGHTFGHALEAATGYSQRLLHGEGVSIGIVLAAQISALAGFCDATIPERIARHFADCGLRYKLSDIPGNLPASDELIQLMGQDKKVKDGRLSFIMLRKIGEAFITPEIDVSVIKALLDRELSR